MITPTPLEKQLVNIDLTKGMDERQRPETMGGITKIENLVTDQTGAWVKRDGTYLGPVEDASGTGTYPVAVKKIFPFINGWGCIGDGGYLLHKQEQQNTFRKRQQHMDLNAKSAKYIGGTGPAAQDPTHGADVVCVASCRTHDAFISVTGNSLLNLTVAERRTGSEYSYRIRSIALPGLTSGVGGSAQCVFVAGRYLHVYISDPAFALKLVMFVIDVLAAMPPNEAAITTVGTAVTLGAGTVQLQDAIGGASYSYVVFLDTGGNSRLVQMDSNANVADSVTFAAETYANLGLNEVTGDVWMIQPSATAFLRAQASAGVSTTTHARLATGKPGTFVSCDTATGNVKILYEYSATFGASVLRSFQVLDFPSPYVATTLVGGAYGWNVVSRPLFLSSSGKHYAQFSKVDAGSFISANVIADISTYSTYGSADPATPAFGSFRIACQLDPNFALQAIGNGFVGSTQYRTLRLSSDDGTEFTAFTYVQTGARTAAVGATRLSFCDATAYGSCKFSGTSVFAHGGINAYDSRNLCEQGFADMPYFASAIGAAGNLNGSYRYFVVYRHVDANGASSYSRAAGPYSSVNALTRNTCTVTQYGITNRDHGTSSYPFIEVYRTKSGGTQYYLCASSQSNIGTSTTPLVQPITFNAVTGLGTFTDNLSDTSLGSQATMYRQPGTPNAAADRYAAPCASIMVQHKDRIFCVDPYGQRIFYSSFFVDGEAAWFNPTFNFFVHDGGGPVTALASMDGRLFIFKRDQVFVVDGDGPGEAGPAGNEFSPPQALASRYGCVDHRSLVVTPTGIMYRSTRGIELLTRNLKVEWIGERVQNTVDTNPYTTGCAMGPDARIYWTLATEPNNVNGLYYVTGCTIVYDTSADAWSVLRSTGYTTIYGHAYQNVAFVQEPIAGAADARQVETLVYADGYIGAWMQNLTSSNDNTNGGDLFTPFTIETGWIKQGMLARQRVSDLLFLAKKRAGSNHAVKLSIAYDYSDTYTQTHTFQPNEILSTVIEEIELQPSKQQVLAIRFKIEDLAPTDTATYPVGTGKGSDVLGIVAEVAPKLGSPKLSTAQKA